MVTSTCLKFYSKWRESKIRPMMEAIMPLIIMVTIKQSAKFSLKTPYYYSAGPMYCYLLRYQELLHWNLSYLFLRFFFFFKWIGSDWLWLSLSLSYAYFSFALSSPTNMQLNARISRKWARGCIYHHEWHWIMQVFTCNVT